MSASLADALRIKRAMERYGVELFVNWPITWSTAVRKAQELVAQGSIGDVWQVKWRGGSMGPFSHGSKVVLPDGTEREMTGPEKAATWWYRAGTGGGAMLDYCCYGACLSRLFVGTPATAVTGMAANLASHYGSVEDNAVFTVRFPKALAVIEATWSCVDHGAASGPYIYGTTGTIVVERFESVQIAKVYRGHGRAPEVYEGREYPAGRATLAQDVFNHLETGAPVHETLDAGFNLQAMAILDAGIRSVASGKTELVDDASWRV